MIQERIFGHTGDGQEVRCIRIASDSGAYVEVLNYGCILHAVSVPDREGKLRDVCLGFDTIAEYLVSESCAGALMGRCTNRIRDASFSLNGKIFHLSANAGRGHIHGGHRGFDKRLYAYRIEEDGVLFTRTSPDGEEGYPGNLTVAVRVSFRGDNALRLELMAQSDQDTIVNLTNHAYWNLAGHDRGSVGGHTLKVNASGYTPMDQNGFPTGQIRSVSQTPFDFRRPVRLDAGWDVQNMQIQLGKGYDHNLALDSQAADCAAELYSEESGICMGLFTTQPGLQIYTANYLGAIPGKGGCQYGPRGGIALEAQGYPDAVHNPGFPSVVLKAGQRYDHVIEYRFTHS